MSFPVSCRSLCHVVHCVMAFPFGPLLSGARSYKSEGETIEGAEERSVDCPEPASLDSIQQQQHQQQHQQPKAKMSRSSSEPQQSRSASTLPPVLHHLVQLFDEIIATTDRVATTALTPSPFLVDSSKTTTANAGEILLTAVDGIGEYDLIKFLDEL